MNSTVSSSLAVCPDRCSNKGVCTNNVCVCENDYLSIDCSVKVRDTLRLSNSLRLSWSIRNSMFYGRLHSSNPLSNTDWMALMFRSENGMRNGYAFRFLSQGDGFTTLASEWYSSGKEMPRTQLTNYIQDVISSSTSLSWDVSFTRPINPSTTDRTLRLSSDPGDEFVLSWSWGQQSNGNWQFHGNNRGLTMVDLVTGDSNDERFKGSLIDLYVPFIVMFILIVFGGLLLHLPPMNHSWITQKTLPGLWARSKAYENAIRAIPDQENGQQSIDLNAFVDKSASRKPPPNQWLQLLDKLTLNVVSTLYSMSIEQLLVSLIYVIIMIYWIANQGSKDPDDARLAFGHLAAIHFTFVLLPVTQRSVWFTLLGLSFERALVYHRAIARLTLIVALIHLGMMVKSESWEILAENESLEHGAGAVYGTVCLVFLFLLIISAAEPIRRRMYEAFYYVHIPFALICVIMAMVHSTYMCYYMIVPLALYVFDRVIRWTRTLRSQPIKARIIGEKPNRIMQLTIQQPLYQSAPGQYAFIRVPAVSKLQSHPFSISSIPNHSGVFSESISFHILENTVGSFTNQFIELVAGHLGDPSVNQSNNRLVNRNGVDSENDLRPDLQLVDHSSNQRSIDVPGVFVDVDGPYGNLSINLGINQLSSYRTVILVAGGVGVTPMASVLGAYLQSTDQSINRVVFVWTTRSAVFLLDLFPELIAQAATDKRVTMLLFTTGKQSNNQSNNQSIKILNGRPDLHAIFTQTARIHHSSNQSISQSSSVAVLACGPPGLVDESQSLSDQFGYHFHKEIFHF